MQLKSERLALVELQIMNVRLRRNLQMLAIDDFLKRFLYERFDDLLPNRILESLFHELRRGLPGAKPRKPDAARVTPGRLLLGLAHRLDRHLNLEKPLDSVALFRRDLNIHVRKANPVLVIPSAARNLL